MPAISKQNFKCLTQKVQPMVRVNARNSFSELSPTTVRLSHISVVSQNSYNCLSFSSSCNFKIESQMSYTETSANDSSSARNSFSELSASLFCQHFLLASSARKSNANEDLYIQLPTKTITQLQ